MEILKKFFRKIKRPINYTALAKSYYQSKELDFSAPMHIGEIQWDFSDIPEKLELFYKIYQERPIKENIYGMKSPHLFWTWYILQNINPAYIIESGVYKGLGTWFIEKACPNAKIYSIDINLSNLVYKGTSVTYFDTDFSTIDWSFIDKDNTVIFFDDHQNSLNRLLQMKKLGFKKAIFEDNYPILQGDCYSCKKILSGAGLFNGKEIIPAQFDDSIKLKKLLKEYIELPPIFKSEKTRWNSEWNTPYYNTPTPIFNTVQTKAQQLLFDEAIYYTWICYTQLH